MKNIVCVCLLLALSNGLLGINQASGQAKKPFSPDLTELARGKGKIVNRTVSVFNEGNTKGVRLDEKEGEGVAWLNGMQFTNGVIEFDVRGKDVLQKSFVGIAFHGKNDSTYDAIYFRPFNFRSEDPVRKSHSVQYISQPTYTWPKLRSEHPGKYENSITPAPDPNAWSHVKVSVDNTKVSVYVNGASAPSLVVDKLSKQPGKLLGLWVGNGSGGDFANLQITATN